MLRESFIFINMKIHPFGYCYWSQGYLSDFYYSATYEMYDQANSKMFIALKLRFSKKCSNEVKNVKLRLFFIVIQAH